MSNRTFQITEDRLRAYLWASAATASRGLCMPTDDVLAEIITHGIEIGELVNVEVLNV
jgi:hypothetical protein